MKFLNFPQGRGAATPKSTQIFDVFHLNVWRSTAAKPNEVEIIFMPPFVRLGIPKLPCVTDRGYLVGEPGNSPPNMTPIFNEIGTIARERITTKCHVTFEIALHGVIAGAQSFWQRDRGPHALQNANF